MGMAGFTIALMMIGVIISPCVYGKEFSDHQEIEVEKLLKLLNKPALKSIKSEDGDIIDCVPIHSQPAFDHPLLKNHTIQMRPSFIPESTSMYTKTNPTQVWHKNGRCPENTVPIRRTKKEDILRSKSHESFGKKTTSSVPEDNLSNNHEPEVQVRSNEFSLAQTWLASGDGANINTIEAGLQADAYKNGCYNTKCPGFVQTSSLITVGGAYNTVSQYDGVQYELSVLIWKSGENWWLRVGEELVGYWPGALFTSLGDGATRVLLGVFGLKKLQGRNFTPPQKGLWEHWSVDVVGAVVRPKAWPAFRYQGSELRKALAGFIEGIVADVSSRVNRHIPMAAGVI
ncbi:hypothetical protein YC2023_048562 [Brassica napus]